MSHILYILSKRLPAMPITRDNMCKLLTFYLFLYNKKIGRLNIRDEEGANAGNRHKLSKRIQSSNSVMNFFLLIVKV